VGWDFGFCGHYWPIVPAPDDRWWWLWRNWCNKDWHGKPKYSEKTCPTATFSTTNPTWLDPGTSVLHEFCFPVKHNIIPIDWLHFTVHNSVYWSYFKIRKTLGDGTRQFTLLLYYRRHYRSVMSRGVTSCMWRKTIIRRQVGIYGLLRYVRHVTCSAGLAKSTDFCYMK
jgi:hypothetical protein